MFHFYYVTFTTFYYVPAARSFSLAEAARNYIAVRNIYLFQRISVLIQRFNATLLHESFADENRSDDWPLDD